MPVQWLFTVLSGVIFLLLTALLLQRKSCRRLTRQLGQLELQLHAAQQAPPRPAERFAEDLMVAERNCPAPQVKPGQEMPDRYRYIRGMARQGMNAAQIATILQVGEEEAAQIVCLARLIRL